MMDREEIEALGEGAGGLGRQEVDDLLELHDAHAELLDHISASPLGWRGSRLMLLRSTTDVDVIEWLQRLVFYTLDLEHLSEHMSDRVEHPLDRVAMEIHPEVDVESTSRSISLSAALRSSRGRLCYLRREMRDGPWHGEPDLVEFRHADLNCLAERSLNGTWCGYVELPVDHSWREVVDDLSSGGVHGGICRIRPKRGALGVEFVGFECDHVMLGDLIPSHPSTDTRDSRYRDLAFVRGEVERMAEMARSAEDRIAMAPVVAAGDVVRLRERPRMSVLPREMVVAHVDARGDEAEPVLAWWIDDGGVARIARWRTDDLVLVSRGRGGRGAARATED